MATGAHPFQAATTALTFDALLNKAPTPPSRLRPDLPPELARIIDRCLQKRREDRYASARDLLADLRRLEKQLATGLVGAHAETRAVPAPPPAVPSIAVLPFVNMSGDQQNDYFGDGLAEELINALTRIAGLRVASRSSTFTPRARQEDVGEIGRRLNVRTVLEGSMRRAGNRLRVSARLVDVADGYYLWSERYDRTLEDVFAIQEEIAQNIAQALRVVLTERERRAIARAPTDNAQAYDCYLRGRQCQHQLSRAGLEQALQMFTRAIEIDADYARACAGKADCHALLYMMWDRSDATLRQADEASRKALELAPDLAEAHAARALALALAKRHDEAAREFDTAIRLGPRLYEAYDHYAKVCQMQGRLAEAARLYEQAAQAQPDDYQALLQLGTLYQGLGRVQDAVTASRLGLEQAEKHLAVHPDDARALALGASSWCLLGEPQRALDWAGRATALGPQEPLTLYNVACVFALLGRPEEAIDCLEQALAKGFCDREWMRYDSDLNALRGRPRFEALLGEAPPSQG
jgi:TolB-like protein